MLDLFDVSATALTGSFTDRGSNFNLGLAPPSSAREMCVSQKVEIYFYKRIPLTFKYDNTMNNIPKI